MHYNHFMVVLTMLFFGLNGCSHKENKGDYVSQSLQDVVAPHQSIQTRPAPEPQAIHPVHGPSNPPIGIVVENGRIIIDTQKTKDFFEKLAKKVDGNFKKIEHDLRQGQTRSPHESGIVFTQDRIEVDLNKTEKFMQKWIKSMKRVGEEMDGLFQELDRSLGP